MWDMNVMGKLMDLPMIYGIYYCLYRYSAKPFSEGYSAVYEGLLAVPDALIIACPSACWSHGNTVTMGLTQKDVHIRVIAHCEAGVPCFLHSYSTMTKVSADGGAAP